MKNLKTRTSINPISFTLFILFNQSYSLDPNYDLCAPKDCGNGLNISYPFYIQGLQDKTCGYPGFELLCNVNGSPTIQISQNNYTIKGIGYQNNTFRVENSKFLSPCTSTLIKNVTLDSNRFALDNRVPKSNLTLLSDCLSNIPSKFDNYKINSCDGHYAMLDDDVNFEIVSRNCGRIVETPVYGVYTAVDGGNYTEVVERGFLMRWLVADFCGECETSGGRCGFNMTAFQFRCFCTDRPHKLSCKPGKNLYVMLYYLYVLHFSYYKCFIKPSKTPNLL